MVFFRQRGNEGPRPIVLEGSHSRRSFADEIIHHLGPWWWWSSGHLPHLPLRQSKFESCRRLQFFCKMLLENNENKHK